MTERTFLIKTRKSFGWTQEYVGNILGITPSFYGMIEKGVRTPRLKLAISMEKLFNIPVSRLFCDVKPNVMLGNMKNTTSSDLKATGTG